MGWIGLKREVLHYLATVGADKDFEGRYLIDTAPPISGMDNQEVVIPDTTRYFVGGQAKALAAGLSSTSYGLAVRVF